MSVARLVPPSAAPPPEGRTPRPEDGAPEPVILSACPVRIHHAAGIDAVPPENDGARAAAPVSALPWLMTASDAAAIRAVPTVRAGAAWAHHPYRRPPTEEDRRACLAAAVAVEEAVARPLRRWRLVLGVCGWVGVPALLVGCLVSMSALGKAIATNADLSWGMSWMVGGTFALLPLLLGTALWSDRQADRLQDIQRQMFRRQIAWTPTAAAPLAPDPAAVPATAAVGAALEAHIRTTSVPLLDGDRTELLALWRREAAHQARRFQPPTNQ